MGKRRSTKKQTFVTRRIPVRKAAIDGMKRSLDQRLDDARLMHIIDRKRRVVCRRRRIYKNMDKPVVYVLSSESFKDPWIKVGYTKELNQRLTSLNTSLPINYKVEGYVPFNCEKTARSAEKEVHEIFYHLKSPDSRELLMVSPTDALTTIKRIRSKTKT